MALGTSEAVLLGDYGTGGAPITTVQLSDFMPPIDNIVVFTEFLASTISDAVPYKALMRDVASPAEAAPGAGVNVDVLAVLKVRDDATGRIKTYSFPGPKAAIFVALPQGDRVTDAVMAQFCTDLGTATGKTYSPVVGYKVQRK